MDASAYLRNQGWRGDGHSLEHTNRGIKKPLLVSKKVDVLGVGLHKHAKVSDQWWLRAFDQGLKSIGTGQQTTLGQVQKHGINRGDLYGRFVKGENIPGSIGQSVLPTPEDSDDSGTGTNTPAELQQAPGDVLTGRKVMANPKNKHAKPPIEKRARHKGGSQENRREIVPAEKVAKYQRRAEQKGMNLEEYIKRREKKNAKKRKEKPRPPQKDILNVVKG